MAGNNKRVVSESSAAKKARANGISSDERKQLREMELLLRIAGQVAGIDTLDELILIR